MHGVGLFGGGIHTIDSFITIIGDTLLTFESNKAINIWWWT